MWCYFIIIIIIIIFSPFRVVDSGDFLALLVFIFASVVAFFYHKSPTIVVFITHNSLLLSRNSHRRIEDLELQKRQATPTEALLSSSVASEVCRVAIVSGGQLPV